jgi:hypothetical protein
VHDALDGNALDGNAVAGDLAEVFGADMTRVVTVCIGCGDRHQVAELVAYVRAPGLVLRCRGCHTVQVTIVRGAGRVRVDLGGVQMLQFDAPHP